MIDDLRTGDLVLYEGAEIGIVIEPNFLGPDPMAWFGATEDDDLGAIWSIQWPSPREFVRVGRMQPPVDGVWPWDALHPGDVHWRTRAERIAATGQLATGEGGAS